MPPWCGCLKIEFSCTWGKCPPRPAFCLGIPARPTSDLDMCGRQGERARRYTRPPPPAPSLPWWYGPYSARGLTCARHRGTLPKAVRTARPPGSMLASGNGSRDRDARRQRANDLCASHPPPQPLALGPIRRGSDLPRRQGRPARDQHSDRPWRLRQDGPGAFAARLGRPERLFLGTFKGAGGSGAVRALRRVCSAQA